MLNQALRLSVAVSLTGLLFYTLLAIWFIQGDARIFLTLMLILGWSGFIQLARLP